MDILINQTNWYMDYLPYFTGGWQYIDKDIYTSNPLNTQISATCTMNPTFVSASQNNSLLVDVEFDCVYARALKGASNFKVYLGSVPFIP